MSGYTISNVPDGKCCYQHWDPAAKRLVPCGAPATAVRNAAGRFIARLCREHAEFWIDAHERVVEPQPEDAGMGLE